MTKRWVWPDPGWPAVARRNSALHVLTPLLGASVTVLLVLRRLIFAPGYVIYRDLFPGQLYYPHLWHAQGSFLALENFKFAPYTGLFLPLRSLGLDIYEKAIYISAMFIAYLSIYVAIYRLLGHLGDNAFPPWVRRLAGVLTGLTYVANPAAANIYFDFSLFVGYAFAPLILMLFIEILERKTHRGLAIIAAAGLWWLGAIKAHWILFGGLLLLPPLAVWMVWHGRRGDTRHIVRSLGATAAIVVVYLLLSAYWLIPFVQASRQRFVGSYAPISYEAIAFLSNAPLRDSVRLLGTFQAWPYVRYAPPTPFLALPWTLASWAIPALALAGLIWFRRHWQAWALALFAVSGIILTKGVAPPLGNLYNGIVFDLMPGSFRWLFRVSSKWNVFLSLGYSALVGFALAKLASRVRWRDRWPRQCASPMLAIVGYLLAFFFFSWPSFTGDFDGALVPVPLPKSLVSANQWLKEQEGDDKVSWIPVTNGRELEWNRRPSGDLYTSLSPKASIGTNWNRHPVLYYSYAYDALYSERVAHFGRLLEPLNTRYVAYHQDVKTEHIHTGLEPVVVLIESGEEALTAHFSRQHDMQLVWQDGFVDIYETAAAAPPLFAPRRVFLCLGDLTLLTSLNAFERFESFQNAILFDSSRSTGSFPQAVDGLLMGHDALDHLAFAMLPAERLLSPADSTLHMALTEAWSRFDIYQFDWQAMLRDYGIYHWGFDYGQGIVAHDSSKTTAPALDMSVHVSETNSFHLWVRHLRHPRAGELRVTVDDRPHSAVPGASPLTGFVWEDLGAIKLDAGEHRIGLSSINGLVAVNVLALVPEQEMRELIAQGQALADRLPSIYYLEAEADFDVSLAQSAEETTAYSAGRAVVLDAHRAISTTLDLVAADDYRVAVRALMSPDASPLTITLGSSILTLTPEETRAGLNWLVAGPVYLDQTSLPIHIETAGSAIVDAFMLYANSAAAAPDALFDAPDPPARIAYERIDPTRYRVQVQAERPFVLALAETFDPFWVASFPDVRVSSVPLYGVINAFFIDRTGRYTIDVEYQAQQWARLGTLLSTITVIAFCPLAILIVSADRGSLHRLRVKLGKTRSRVARSWRKRK